MDLVPTLLCPLCHNLVRANPDRRERDVQAIGRHLARECTVRIV